MEPKLIGTRRVIQLQLTNPARGFQLEIQQLEYRRDFFGIASRINLSRALRKKQAAELKIASRLEQMVSSTQPGCYFCPHSIQSATPKFIQPPERIIKGECWLFPNLYPFGQNHAVATMGSSHYLELDRFHSELIKQNLEATLEFLEQVRMRDPSARYPSWSWNHLPPGAASIIHPHTQILVERNPTPLLRKLIFKSRRYFSSTGRNYWSDLVELEKQLGARFLAQLSRGSSQLMVLSSFSPMGSHELLLIIPGMSSLIQLDSRRIELISEAISRALKGYHALGLNSFTLTSFSGPMDSDLTQYYWLNLRLISRPIFREFYTADTGFMERFQGEYVVDTLPEELSSKLRPFFS